MTASGLRATWGWWVALALLLGLHLAAGLAWLRLDARPDLGICCELVPHLQAAVRFDEQGALSLLWQPQRGWAQLLAVPLLRVSPDATLISALLAMGVAQVLAALCARTLAGPGAGLLAAAYLPLLPLLTLAERRFDVFAPLAAVVLLCLLLLLASRGLTRLPAVLALAAACLLLATCSPVPTDNYLALGAVGAMTGTAWLRSLAWGRDHAGAPVDRRRAALGGVVLLALVVLVLVSAPHRSSDGAGWGLDYYRTEILDPTYGGDRAWSDPVSLFAYAGHLYWRGLTAWHGTALLLALPLFLWRGRGRAEVLGLVLPLLVVLSPLPKKNYYYLAAAWPGLVLVVVLGIAALPWRTPRRLAGGLLLAMALGQWAARSWPTVFEGTPLAEAGELPYDESWGGTLQGFDDHLSLAPRPPGAGAEIHAVLEGLVDAPPCACRYTVLALPPTPAAEWWLQQVRTDPCLQQEDWSDPPVSDHTGVLLLPRPDRPPSPLEAERLADTEDRARALLRLVATVDAGGMPIEIWARDEAWLAEACRPR